MRSSLADAPRWVQTLVPGTLFGAATGLWPYLSGESVISAVGLGAVAGGDPAVRASAARLAAVQLAESRRHRLRDVAVIAVVTLWAVPLALSSPWWSLAEAGSAALLVGRLWEPRHLQRRLALLEDAGVSPGPARAPH